MKPNKFIAFEDQAMKRAFLPRNIKNSGIEKNRKISTTEVLKECHEWHSKPWSLTKPHFVTK